MSHPTDSALVVDDTSTAERLAGAVVGLGLVTFAFSLVGVAQVVTAETTVLGISLYDFLAGGLLRSASVRSAGCSLPSSRGAQRSSGSPSHPKTSGRRSRRGSSLSPPPWRY